MPLSTPVTRIIVYENPDARNTWAPHDVNGWYLGSAIEHYRYYCTWIWATEAERIGNIV